MRILLVENHETFAATVRDCFLGDHYVVVCGSIGRARKLAASEEFDAVLVDYDLDDGKGVEVVRWLRERRFRGRVIAISSHDDGNEALRRAGAHAVCRKADFPTITELLGA